MKKNPLVSIIIPFYNEEKYFDKCLSSLTSQTYERLETILIDDGSKDNSLKIAKKYKFKILRQKHQGPGVARNKGARVAKGSILCFMDADMKYDKDYIKRLIGPIIKKQAIGTFNLEFVANKEKIWSSCFSINSDLPPGERTHERNAKESDIFRAILKSEFEKSGGFNPSLGYVDDKSISTSLGKKSTLSEGAISHHYNPESLREVFLSSRWVGRSIYFKRDVQTLLRFSMMNSIRNAFKKISKGAPLAFLIFKIVYDLGLLSGVFFSGGKKAK